MISTVSRLILWARGNNKHIGPDFKINMKIDKMTDAEAIKNGIYMALMIMLLFLSFSSEHVIHSNLFVSLSIMFGLFTLSNISNQTQTGNE